MENFARARTALGFEASEAASLEIAKLETLIDVLSHEHGAEVVENPELAAALARLCAAMGTDPLTVPLGVPKQSREAQDRLGIGVVEVCREMQARNGGSIPLEQLTARLSQHFGTTVAEADVVHAIDELAVFGPGLHLERLANGTQVVRTAAGELSMDQGDVFVASDALGYVDTELLQTNLKWDKARAQRVLDDMVRAGLLWVDNQARPPRYYNPSFI